MFIRLYRKIRESLYWRRLYNRDVFQWRVEKARSWGVKIGEGCRLYTLEFSTEPYLVEIGDHVVIGSGTQFITHDGGTWVINYNNDLENHINCFGKIIIGSNCFIGINCIFLPNSEVGDNCVIGAGSVVRGKIPSGSVVMGNPAKVVMKLPLYKKMIENSKNSIRVNLWNKNLKDRLVRKHFGRGDR